MKLCETKVFCLLKETAPMCTHCWCAIYKACNTVCSFFKENVRYPIWIFRDPIFLILGTWFSLIPGTRW